VDGLRREAPGQRATRTPDDRRHGTTPLRAARAGATGTGVGRMTQRHRSRGGGAGHSRHSRGPQIGSRACRACGPSPRIEPLGTVPVTPTAAAGMTAVAGVVATRARPRRTTALVTALAACSAAVEGSIEHPDAHDAKPCRWRRDPGDRVASWKRGHRRLQDRELSV